MKNEIALVAIAALGTALVAKCYHNKKIEKLTALHEEKVSRTFFESFNGGFREGRKQGWLDRNANRPYPANM